MDHKCKCEIARNASHISREIINILVVFLQISRVNIFNKNVNYEKYIQNNRKKSTMCKFDYKSDIFYEQKRTY